MGKSKKTWTQINLANFHLIDWDALANKGQITLKIAPPSRGMVGGVSLSTIVLKLRHRKGVSPYSPAGWVDSYAEPEVYSMLTRLWSGSFIFGRNLYLKGEAPLHKKTADSLPVGTVFVTPSGSVYQVDRGRSTEKVAKTLHQPDSFGQPAEFLAVKTVLPASTKNHLSTKKD